MTGWIVFAAVLAALALLSLVRLGAQLTYGKDGLIIKVRVGLLRVTVFRTQKKPKRSRRRRAPEGRRVAPRQGKSRPAGRRLAGQTEAAGPSAAPKQPQEKAEAAPPSAQKTENRPPSTHTQKPGKHPPAAAEAQGNAPDGAEKREDVTEEKKGGLPLPLLELIDFALDAVGALISRLQIDTLEVDYTIAGKRDPASAAIQYGMICAGGGTLVAVLENSFYRIRRREIRAQVDFEATEPLIWLLLSLSLRLGQIVALACRLGLAFYRKLKNQRQEEEKDGTEASDQ